jgi:hypothetical protein
MKNKEKTEAATIPRLTIGRSLTLNLARIVAYFAASLILFVAFSPLIADEKPPSKTVCEALDEIIALDGQIVAIRGEVNGFQGGWIEGKNCERHIEVRGHPFPDRIAITSPTSLARVHIPSFGASRKSVTDLNSALGEAIRRHGVVVATLIGLLETRLDRNQLISRSGQRIGFGHLGHAPAQLLLKEVIDITIEQKDERKEEQQRQEPSLLAR